MYTPLKVTIAKSQWEWRHCHSQFRQMLVVLMLALDLPGLVSVLS